MQRDLEHERGAAKDQAALVAEMRTAFTALSSDVLKSNSDQFLVLAKSAMSGLEEKAAGESEKRERAVAELVKPIQESLTRVDGRLEQLERTEAAARAKLSAEMRGIVEASDRLRSETGSLATALRQPHTRGRWGELQLRRVVEMVGMTRYCDFVEQVTVNADDGRLRPDLVVNLPGGKQVVVDAKAPLQRFLDAADSRDDEDRRCEHLVAHARDLRQHMAKLSAKSYWSQFEAAPDFVILFLPGEHFYSAALEIDPGLIEEGVKQCVLVATPMTLITLLRAVSYGWQQEKVAESARYLRARPRASQPALLLVGRVETLGGRLQSTVKAYNETVGTLEARVLPSTRRFADHGAVSREKELPGPAVVETAPRAVRAPELRVRRMRTRVPSLQPAPPNRATGACFLAPARDPGRVTDTPASDAFRRTLGFSLVPSDKRRLNGVISMTRRADPAGRGARGRSEPQVGGDRGSGSGPPARRLLPGKFGSIR